MNVQLAFGELFDQRVASPALGRYSSDWKRRAAASNDPRIRLAGMRVVAVSGMEARIDDSAQRALAWLRANSLRRIGR